jgi:aryl-alcohol dehydrogenase-like predicted oxidoreductase
MADMAAFVEAGITTFDCADIYTGVEALIGEFLRTRPPWSVRVHTKYVPDLATLGTHTVADAERVVRRSRERLGVEALDLVQFHWWDYTAGDFVAAGLTLAELQARGALRAVGVTNFGTPQLQSLIDAGVPVVSHQVQYSLLDRRPAGTMHPLCAAHDIGLLCYGALAGGFFHERWLGAPEPVEPMDNRSLVKYKLIIDECGGWAHFQRLLELLSVIGRDHGVRIGTVAIRWVLDQPAVTSVIVGARNASHLGDTLAATSLRLSDAAHRQLAEFLAHSPVPPGDVYELERDREGRHGRIMRYNLSTEDVAR